MDNSHRLFRLIALSLIAIIYNMTPAQSDIIHNKFCSPSSNKIKIVTVGSSANVSRQDNNRQQVHIDAFDTRKCGDAHFRPWQLKQRAFGCDDSTEDFPPRCNNASTRIVDGTPAAEGEFPFFVHLIINIKGSDGFRRRKCGGTLVHNNLVVTAAHCVAFDVEKIEVVLGTNRYDKRGGISVEANILVIDYRYRENSPLWDLAVLRLAQPVDYEANKIAPACIRLKQRNSETAECAIAGKGLINELKEQPDRLLSIRTRRRCPELDRVPWRSCYMADNLGKTCYGDSGGPVICYDKCGSRATKAFLVGVHRAGIAVDSCVPGEPAPAFVTDLNWNEEVFLKLLSKAMEP